LLSLKPNGCQEKLNQFTLGELIAIPTPDFWFRSAIAIVSSVTTTALPTFRVHDIAIACPPSVALLSISFHRSGRSRTCVDIHPTASSNLYSAVVSLCSHIAQCNSLVQHSDVSRAFQKWLASTIRGFDLLKQCVNLPTRCFNV
jgi:hypothetical protein